MGIYLIEAEVKVRHLYSVQSKTEDEAKKYLEVMERNKGEFDGNNLILDKVWVGTISNEIIDSNEIEEVKKMETNYEIIGVTDIDEVTLDIEIGIEEVGINE